MTFSIWGVCSTPVLQSRSPSNATAIKIIVNEPDNFFLQKDKLTFGKFGFSAKQVWPDFFEIKSLKIFSDDKIFLES